MATPKKRGGLAKSAASDQTTSIEKKPTGKPKPAGASAKADAAAKAAENEPQLNRDQRRRAKFGGGRPAADPNEPWPQADANPAFGRGGDDQAAYAGRPDQDVTRNTGPGTGGATQEPTQRPEHEGAHAGQSTKG